MSRGVDNVEAVVFPETTYSCRLNGNTALGFLLHEVGSRFAIVGLARFVNFTGQLEDTLGGRGFTRVNVSEDTNISVF